MVDRTIGKRTGVLEVLCAIVILLMLGSAIYAGVIILSDLAHIGV